MGILVKNRDESRVQAYSVVTDFGLCSADALKTGGDLGRFVNDSSISLHGVRRGGREDICLKLSPRQAAERKFVKSGTFDL